MEEEIFITGYCRQLDQSRRVLVECFDGEKEADCCYPDCPYVSNCTVAQEIAQLTIDN